MVTGDYVLNLVARYALQKKYWRYSPFLAKPPLLTTLLRITPRTEAKYF